MLREAESDAVERAKGSPGLPIQPNRAFGRLPARLERAGCSEMVYPRGPDGAVHRTGRGGLQNCALGCGRSFLHPPAAP